MVHYIYLALHLLQRSLSVLPYAHHPVVLSPRRSCHNPRPVRLFIETCIGAVVQRLVFGICRGLCAGKGSTIASRVVVHVEIFQLCEVIIYPCAADKALFKNQHLHTSKHAQILYIPVYQVFIAWAVE